MAEEIFSSDMAIVDVLRKHSSMTVLDLASAMDVTPTAVRQRLTRLMAQGYVDRVASKAPRGRPCHRYALTREGRRKAGSNFGDLAVALWNEVVAIQDPAVRRVLIQRVSERLADTYADQVKGPTVEQRMEQLAKLFRDRRVSFSVEHDNGTPKLTAHCCPYPDLSHGDRNICAMERQLLTRLLGTRLSVLQCRHDGDDCCSFEPDSSHISEPTAGVAAGG
jgi:DeoR family transcriptional regulator, suf operon transcriptional repressor